MNTARGAAAWLLGDIIIHDTDGNRTRLVTPALDHLASDPSIGVRSCVAHLIGACLSQASQEALVVYRLLLVADDRLLAAQPAVQLAAYIGMRDSAMLKPVVERMLQLTELVADVQRGQDLGGNARLARNIGHAGGQSRCRERGIRRSAGQLASSRCCSQASATDDVECLPSALTCDNANTCNSTRIARTMPIGSARCSSPGARRTTARSASRHAQRRRRRSAQGPHRSRRRR